MRLLGFNITREKAARPAETSGAWRSTGSLVREPFSGAWQRGLEVRPETAMSFHAVFACQTMIASDIAKCRLKLVEVDANGIWAEVSNPAYSPVLRKPNLYQNRIQFFESWALSKLRSGNTYVLKERDGRGVVIRLHVLNPEAVTPMVAPDGSVFYRLTADNLTGQAGSITVPARELIHDRFNCLFHPLIGISPLYANALASTQGLEIMKSSAKLFANSARPGGILSAPGRIDEANAERLKRHWESNYSGDNAGRVAILGDNLKFERAVITAEEGQLIEQLKWSAEVVCSTYHMPPYKIGVGALPSHNNIQALNIEYYSQCLQVLFEAIELCLDEGLSTGDKLGTEFDLDNLLRMDMATQMEVLSKGTGAGLMEIDEGRGKLGLRPTPGGNAAYLQQQNYSLAALARRDAAAPAPADPAISPPDPEPEQDALNDEQRALLVGAYLRKELGLAA